MQIYLTKEREVKIRQYSESVNKSISGILGGFIDSLPNEEIAGEKINNAKEPLK